MRGRHWWAMAAGMAVLAAGAVKWYASQQHATRPLPAELDRQDPVLRPVPKPAPVPTVASAPRPYEPIVVLTEPFTDPPRPPADVPAVGGAQESAAPAARSNPRPEPFVLRMPYADEELSEFALLLQRAATHRRDVEPLASPTSTRQDASSGNPPD